MRRNPECIHTHIESTDPLIYHHYKVWHEKALERCHDINEENELIFTSPLSISRRGAQEIREKILKVISDVREAVDQGEPEELFCLNIDWVKIKK